LFKRSLISLNKFPITELSKIILLFLNFQNIKGKKKININDIQFKKNIYFLKTLKFFCFV